MLLSPLFTSLAVTTVLPVLIPLTVPALTLATVVSLLLQMISPPVTEGVAVRVVFCPFFTAADAAVLTLVVSVISSPTVCGMFPFSAENVKLNPSTITVIFVSSAEPLTFISSTFMVLGVTEPMLAPLGASTVYLKLASAGGSASVFSDSLSFTLTGVGVGSSAYAAGIPALTKLKIMANAITIAKLR